MKGFIIDNDYSSDESGTTVQLFGRLENGESFVVNNKFVPYFFIEAKNQKKLGNLLKQFEVEKTNLTTFSGEEVLKISHVSFQKLGILIKAIHAKEIRSFESDIRPNMRYIIDFDLKGGIEIEGDYESSERVDRVYNNAKIFPSDFVSKLKILSIDTESGSDGKLFCIGMYSEGFEKEFMVGKGNIPGVNFCKDEETCLEKFRESVLEFDPDIITGWNLISFDLQYLQGLFRKYKMNFDIARTNENLRLKIETNFFKSSSANLVGRQVIDGLNLIKDPFIQEAPSIKNSNFESYTLENVSQVILKKGKLLKGNNRHEEIESLYNSGSEKSLKKLADYNLLDCKLVYEILEKTKMIDLGLERVQLTGMTLDRLTASIAAFDSVYFREARKRGLVSPATIFGNKEQKLKGGYVFSLKPGVYHNVLIFDFKSLYPSIIKTFNIDPASYLGNSHKGEKKYVEAPNKVFFRNSEGILPDIIQNLHLAREKAKKEKRELSSYAIKIIMNSFWGVLASPNCRYFDFNMASAITSFAREIIQLTAEKIEQKKFKVIYSDTDSVFVETNLDKDKAQKVGLEIQDYINNFYNDYIRKKYDRNSFLELEFEKQYISMLIPMLRSKEGDEEDKKAAKKRYAGLIYHKDKKEELEIVGLEAIRGDWTDAAGDFQRELLLKVFRKQEVASFIKEYVKKVKDGKLDDKLLYRKSIRKELQEYTKTTPPHVKAARKLDKLDSNIIEYYITLDGPEPVQKLTHKLDYEHYIEKQIKPIANQVLNLFDKNFDEELHSDFLKFGKGEFRNKYLIDAKKQKDKLVVKTGPEFANYLVRYGLKKASGKVSVSGVIVSTLQLDIPISKGIKQFMGVKQYQVSGDIDSREVVDLMEKYPKAFFALSFVLPDYELKIKAKAPKSAKPSTSGEKEAKAEFCSLKTNDKNFEKEFFFDVKNDFKEISIKHTIKITDMIYPKDFAKMKPEEVREVSKRKGILIRELEIDGKAEKREASFEA